MEKISDYILQEKLGETNKSVVYRGIKDSADTTVIIKLLKIERASPTDIAHFKSAPAFY